MKVAINLSDFKSYQDTLLMLNHIAQKVEKLYILTNQWEEFPQSIEKSSHLEIIAFPKAKFRTLAIEWLFEHCLSVPLEDRIDIVHDFFGHLCRFFEEAKMMKDRRFRTLNTQRTSNTAWFELVRPLGFELDQSYVQQRIISLWRDLRLFKQADHIVVLGPGHDQEIISHYGVPNHHVSWFPSEIDLRKFLPDFESAIEAKVVLYTGRIFRNKGLEDAFAVMFALKDQIPDLKFVLIGEVPFFERKWFESQMTESRNLGLEVVHLLHMPREHLIRYYQTSGVYLFPSLFEGSPRSVREAIACGLPAVLSDIPGHRGIDPEEGFVRFFPVRDREAMKRQVLLQIEENLSDLDGRRLRAQRGIDWLMNNHHPERVADRYCRLYGELLAREI
jgi:glycosyltransferase involved in cell wall biosynthesis